MSAVGIRLISGTVFYTKDYDTVEETKNALSRAESLSVFWFTDWGKRFQETLLVGEEQVAYYLTERDIP